MRIINKNKFGKLILIFFIFSLSLLSMRGFSQGSGKVLSFNGSNTYVDLGTTVAAGTRTIELWFKPGSSISSGISDAIALVIRDYNNGSGYLNEFGLYFTPGGWIGMNGGALVFYRNLGSSIVGIQSDNTFWQQNVWYHVSAVIDPVSGMKMYINGELQMNTDPSTQAVPNQTGSVTDMVAIGTWGYPSVRNFDGDIDEVRFWTTARSQTQVRNKMCSKLSGTETGLRAYYRFDNSSGTTLTDATNSFNGTLHSFSSSPWHYSSAPIGDTSTYVYPSSGFSGVNLNLLYNTGENFAASNITGNSGGAHIFRVNSLPNSISGVGINPLTDYYGVFLTGTTGNYDINYDYSYLLNCSKICRKLFSRNDNAVLSWSSLNGTTNNCSVTKTNESTSGESYREEYIFSDVAYPGGLGNDITNCNGNPATIGLGFSGMNIIWSTGATTQNIQVTLSGNYWVNYTYNGCSFSDTIQVFAGTPPAVNIGPDTSICPGNVITLNATTSGATYNWNTGSTSPIINVSSSGIYWADVTVNGCVGRDSMIIIYKANPSVSIGNDTNLCDQTNLTLNAIANTSPVSWSGGTIGNSLPISSSGTYVATVSINGCSASDSVRVNFSSSPVVNIGPDTTVCVGSSFILSANTPSMNYLWNTGQTTQTISPTQGGIYWVTVTNNFGCKDSDTALINAKAHCEVAIIIPNVFSPDGDNINENFIPVIAENIQKLQITIYNRWGEKLFESDDVNFSWNGKYNGGDCTEGTYYYLANYTDIFKKSATLKG